MIGLIAIQLMQRFALDPRTAGWIARGVLASLAFLALYAAYSWAWDRGRDHERARWEAASAKVVAADVKADAKGLATAGETKGTIDAENERAKAAAAGSDDPLAAGLNSLREEGAGGRGKTTP